MDKNAPGLVNMKDLLLLCTKLCIQSCEVVKEGYQNKNLKKYYKEGDDPVTQTDFKIQTIISKGLKSQYPNIKIVGEQTKQYQGDSQISIQKLSDVVLPIQISSDIWYQLDHLCVWIDPVDNTRGFVGDQIWAVTVLVGISYHGKCQLGIVGHPYKRQSDGIHFKPSTVIGCVSQKFAYQIYSENRKWIKLEKPKNTLIEKPKAYLGKNNFYDQLREKLNAQHLLAGGVGYKCIAIARQQVHLYCYFYDQSQKWDTCAGEAALKALGGYIVSGKGQELYYDPTASDYFNKYGIICGFQQSFKQKAIEVIKKVRPQLN